MDYFGKLAEVCRKKNTLLCVGLDPRVDGAADPKAAIIEANRRIIEATAPYTACYKPNIAFYEAHGPRGIEALEETLALIPDGIPVLLDAKRNDIGATAEAYAAAAFDHLKADAVTLGGYMGRSSAEPFFSYPEKGFFFLCRTSNPLADQVQDLSVNGGLLYEEMAKQITSWSSRAGLVVAGNDTEALKRVRAVCPEAWFLSPGIGAQGGTMEEAVEAGLRADGLGILPVVVRAIANADDPAEAAKTYRDQLNAARDRVMARRSGVAPADPFRQELLKGLVDTGCFRLGEFTLKSGLKSPFYVDLRRVGSDPRVLQKAAKAYAKLLEGMKCDRIAGIPVAALPLATAVSLETGIPLIYPRMEKKAHGSGNLIEGEWHPGESVVLLDDLITTGKSKVEAIEILRDAGLVVKDLVVLLERGVQGRRDMDAAGINLASYAHVQEFFSRCREMGLIDEVKEQSLLDYVAST